MTGTGAPSGRLLLHRNGEAAWNMAMDQAIAEAASEQSLKGATSAPTLRLYDWAEPTLSLGYFQKAAESEPRFATTTRVRRSTGGGAIVHDRELTYSLVISTPLAERGARSDLYAGVHQAIADALAEHGFSVRPYHLDPQSDWPAEKDFLCFRRRTDDDLVTSGYKVVGSAQRRHRGAILQHGSILLETSPFAPELPGLWNLSSNRITFEWLADSFARKVSTFLDCELEPAETTSWEQQRAQLIEQSRFDSEDWFHRR